MGDTDNSDFGSDGGGKNYKCHVIPNALRVPKMYILSMLENSRVITIPITLCHTVAQKNKYTPRLMNFCFVHLDHLPKGNMTQMIYHLKALI